MLIDIIVIIFLVLAIIKGYRKGLIVGLFSLVAGVIGLAAALKLSVVVSKWLGQSVTISEKWLPFISFAIVFIVVIVLIRWLARLIEQAVKLVLLGWLNTLGGIIFYILIYLLVLSVILFYVDQMKFLQPASIENSITYAYIQPLGPQVISWFGQLLPVFKDLFEELKNFFGGISTKVPVI